MTPAFTHRVLLGAVVLTAALACSGGNAQAQAGNMPYGSGGGPGISFGARQVILNAQQLGSRPRNLVRGADGSLLDVSRRNGQAFLRLPSGEAVTSGARAGRGWATGLGTGLGWGNMGGLGGAAIHPYGRSGSAADSMMQWISLLNTNFGLSASGVLSPPGSGATPIDSWIGQNDLS